MIKKISVHIVLFVGICLSISNTAHADFRKAIEALQRKDGPAMLAEVKDAAEKKSNDGLMLFLSALSIDASTSAKSNLYESTKDKRPSTIKSILTETQQQELFDLLMVATNNSTADAQYLLARFIRSFHNPKQISLLKTIDEYANSGSLVAMYYSSASETNKAEAGIPFSQFRLGLKYLNFVDYDGYGCNEPPADPICHSKDEDKGYYWLMQALKSYEAKGHDDIGVYAGAVCDLLRQNPKENKAELKQAYLWCVTGINSGGQSSWRLLGKMQQAGKLKIAAPEVDAIWGTSVKQDKDRLSKALNLTEHKELPNWLVDARNELAKKDLPVFSYYADDYMQYELDVYADGRVSLGFGEVNNGYPGHEPGSISFVDTKKDFLMKVSPAIVSEFIVDIKKIGFYDWPLNNQIPSFCDNFDPTRCLPKRYQVTVRNGTKYRRVYLSGLAWDIAKIGGGRDKETPVTTRIAQVSALVEQYFPTQGLRCNLSASEEYKHACLQRDNRWATLAK